MAGACGRAVVAMVEGWLGAVDRGAREGADRSLKWKA